MSAFFAIAGDVPRRIRRGWFMWILLLLIVVVLGLVAFPLGKSVDPEGAEFLTWWGKDMRPRIDGHYLPMEMQRELREFVGGFFGLMIACYLGVFTGVIMMADAVTSAFAPGQAELNLPKPVRRSTIVLARHVGAMFMATFFATFLVGGAVLIAWLKTKIFVAEPLAYIPVSVAIFGLLHAVGAIAGAWIQNALIAAFASAITWIASLVTNIPNWWEGYEKLPYPLLVSALDVVKYVHRALPRTVDVPGLANRIIEHKFGEDPLGKKGEVELILNTGGWWILALVLAILVIRRRDF